MSGAKRNKHRKRTAAGGTGAGGTVRERLLDAAIAILQESGLQHFTQVQVAERAGVRQSHLTYYFPTREDLLEAVTARGVERLAHGVGVAAGHGEVPGDAPLLERLAAAITDVGHMRMFLGMVVESDGDPAVRELLVAGTHQLEAALAEALGGDDARERAPRVLAALWGLGLYQFLVRPSQKSFPARAYLSSVAATTAAAPTVEPSGARDQAGGRRSRTSRE